MAKGTRILLLVNLLFWANRNYAGAINTQVAHSHVVFKCLSNARVSITGTWPIVVAMSCLDCSVWDKLKDNYYKITIEVMTRFSTPLNGANRLARLTSCGKVLVKLYHTKVIEGLLAFYGTRKFVIMFARACLWPNSWARRVQFGHSGSFQYSPTVYAKVLWLASPLRIQTMSLCVLHAMPITPSSI